MALDTRTDPLQSACALAPRFAERASVWDRERRYCHDNIRDLVDAGLMGMTIPVEYGGRGASWLDTCHVIEEIAGACALTARIVVEANMGAVSAIMAYGTEAQRRLAAGLVLAGDKPAICITEPEAGSDAIAMTTTARKADGGWRIAGRKHWITGGGVSKLHLVFARIEDTDRIGGFLIVADPVPQGFRVTGRERTMGLCGMPEASLSFEDVFVHEDMRLDAGFADLMTAYNSQRVGAGTVALGIAAGALDRAAAYAGTREQFGRPIAGFQGLQWMLADMDTGVHAARLMLHDAARSGGAFPDRTAAARAKVFATETAIRVVDQALQVFGARGYGSDEPLERMYRDVRMFTIGGGTAQVLRTEVAAGLLRRRLPQR